MQPEFGIMERIFLSKEKTLILVWRTRNDKSLIGNSTHNRKTFKSRTHMCELQKKNVTKIDPLLMLLTLQ